jgi:polysaccharide transporter, PST family
MVTTFSLLLVNFGLNGFTEAVLQCEDFNHFLASNLFWINIFIGMLLTVAFAASGPLFAHFYGNPLVSRVTVGASLSIIVTSVSVLHLALLRRAMYFSAVSINDVIARIVSVAVTVILGWAGWGYWALISGIVAQPLSQTIGALILCEWIPSFPRRIAGTASATRFALNIYGRFGVNYFARNTDNLIVGWRFGAGALGFYKKAYDLFLLSACQLVAPLTNVAVSALSRLNKESAQYRRYLLSAIGITAFVGMGLGADLTLVGKDVIRVLLGPGWVASGRIFSFFGPGVGIMLVYGTHGWIHLSLGTADRWFRWVFVEFAVTGSLFLGGAHWGPSGIAAAWTLSFWILAIPAFWYAGKPIRLNVSEVANAIWRYALASLAAGMVAAAIFRRLQSPTEMPSLLGALSRIAIMSTIFVVLYVGIVILFYGGCAPVYQLARVARNMIPWRKLEPSVTDGRNLVAG